MAIHPFPFGIQGLVPFSNWYNQSTTFVVPPGCNFVNLEGRGAYGSWDITRPYVFCHFIAYNSRSGPPPSTAVAYNGLTFDQINQNISQLVLGPIGVGAPNIRNLRHYYPQPNNISSIENIVLYFSAADPAPGDTPYMMNQGAALSTGTPPDIWVTQGYLIGRSDRAVRARIGLLTSSGTYSGGPLPTGGGPITWGSLDGYYRYSTPVPDTVWAEWTMLIDPEPLLVPPAEDVQYPMAGNGVYIPEGGPGPAATGFGQTFPGSVFVPASGATLGYPDIPAILTFDNVATTPGNNYPLVIPNTAYIKVSGWRFP